jgi:hypothetical protein
MNIILTMILPILAIAAILALFAVLLLGSARTGFDVVHAANIGVGTHQQLTRYAEVAIPRRNLLVKQGTAENQILINGVADRPLGTIVDTADTAHLTDEPKGVELLGIAARTLLMVSAAAIPVNVDVFAAADGKVSVLPVADGTYWCVGRSVTSVAAADVEVEVAHCRPFQVVVSS